MQWLVCRSFIEAKRKEAKEELFAFLDPKRKKELLALPPPGQDLTLGFDVVRHLLKWTHSSWFAPLLRAMPEHEIPLFLSAFPEDKKQELCDLLLCQKPTTELSPLAKNFLQKKIIQSLLVKKPDLFPIEALPASDLLGLLDLSSKGLHLLVKFLGLFDLSSEMRLIIDKVRTKKIESALSKEELFFLSSLITKQYPSLFKPIGLQSWNGTEQELITLLHKRGMNRLSKALFPENKDFILYITLRMSCEEEALFTSLHKKLEPVKMTSVLVKQIEEVLIFFHKNKFQVFA